MYLFRAYAETFAENALTLKLTKGYEILLMASLRAIIFL